MNGSRLPFVGRALLLFFLNYNHPATMMGDYEEIFTQLSEQKGRSFAWFWFWGQVFLAFPFFLRNALYWGKTMFGSYLKISVRHIRKHKIYSLINIAGLAIGMACCILIFLWVQDELGFDRFHKNSNRIFRALSTDHSGGEMFRSAGVPSLLGPTLVDEYPEVVKYTRCQVGWSGYYLHRGDKNFMWEKLATVDPSFFKVFHFPFIAGDPETALLDKHSIVLTESLAKKIFANEEPMGQVLKISDRDFEVTAVIEDIPANSHLQFDYAFPAINMADFRESRFDSWTYSQFATYIELEPQADAEALEEKIAGIVKTHLPQSRKVISLQALKDIHLHSKGIDTWMIVYAPQGNKAIVTIFILTALSILLLACVNFMNLATARATTRMKEVGLRKVVGADKKDLIKQFMGESILFSLLAFIVSLLLVKLLLPVFNTLSGKGFSLDFSADFRVYLGLLGIVALTGFLSGSYPALFLSSFRPVNILRSATLPAFKKHGTMRKLLVVGQFAFSITLIAITIVMYSQFHFIKTKDLGYDQENLISFASYGEIGNNYESVRNELLQNPDILSVCRGFPPRQSLAGTTEVDWEGKDASREFLIHEDTGGYDYLQTFGLEMAEGRFFSREFPTDPDHFILNETAVRRMGIKSPVGKRLTYKGKTGNIIGVLKDYHGGSLHYPIQAKVFTFSPGFFTTVKFRSGKTAETVAYLEDKWNKFVPGYPFRYGFLDEDVANLYETDKKVGRIFQYFTFLAVFISCLGLFGLASFMVERRTKEIGIRKVLGAKVLTIILLLSKEFMKWVLLANMIAWPVSFLITRNWLRSFAYRINLSLSVFLFSALLALIIAVITVSFQAFKAARANPIHSLRYE
jgi:putative ABC transport system permease protein